MTEKIVVPTENQEGIKALIAEHFGRSPYFTIVELDNGKIVNVSTVENTSEHVGGVGSPFDALVQINPKAVIVNGMGPRGIMNFNNAGVKVLRANSVIVSKIVEAYTAGQLEDLTEGCSEAHHHH
ncbi:MAG: NifB/NifX family molybdenum-iron cluster-binding protein [Candidatus Bathyarchaeia archaeon]|jgi:predicted Fe-Mo cluster-binding NifX family protein